MHHWGSSTAGLPHVVSSWHSQLREEEWSGPCLGAVGAKSLVGCWAKTGPRSFSFWSQSLCLVWPQWFQAWLLKLELLPFKWERTLSDSKRRAQLTYLSQGQGPLR